MSAKLIEVSPVPYPLYNRVFDWHAELARQKFTFRQVQAIDIRNGKTKAFEGEHFKIRNDTDPTNYWRVYLGKEIPKKSFVTELLGPGKPTFLVQVQIFEPELKDGSIEGDFLLLPTDTFFALSPSGGNPIRSEQEMEGLWNLVNGICEVSRETIDVQPTEHSSEPLLTT